MLRASRTSPVARFLPECTDAHTSYADADATRRRSTRQCNMLAEATTAGFYHSPGWGKNYPALRVLTIAELTQGRAQVQMPPVFQTFKQAQRVKATAPSALSLFPGEPDEWCQRGIAEKRVCCARASHHASRFCTGHMRLLPRSR